MDGQGPVHQPETEEDVIQSGDTDIDPLEPQTQQIGFNGNASQPSQLTM